MQQPLGKHAAGALGKPGGARNGRRAERRRKQEKAPACPQRWPPIELREGMAREKRTPVWTAQKNASL